MQENLTACQQDVFALPVVDNSGTSCYHLLTRSMRPDSQKFVPTNLISSARNKLFIS